MATWSGAVVAAGVGRDQEKDAFAHLRRRRLRTGMAMLAGRVLDVRMGRARAALAYTHRWKELCGMCVDGWVVYTHRVREKRSSLDARVNDCRRVLGVNIARRVLGAWWEWHCGQMVRRVNTATARGHAQCQIMGRFLDQWRSRTAHGIHHRLINDRATFFDGCRRLGRAFVRWERWQARRQWRVLRCEGGGNEHAGRGERG